MIKKYKICKSEYYSEENKQLSKSYVCTYFNERRNEWRDVKNYDIKNSLKALANNPNVIVMTKELHIDFDKTKPSDYIIGNILDVLDFNGRRMVIVK